MEGASTMLACTGGIYPTGAAKEALSEVTARSHEEQHGNREQEIHTGG